MTPSGPDCWCDTDVTAAVPVVPLVTARGIALQRPPRAAAGTQRDADALDLRSRGCTLQQIGDTLFHGDKSKARKAVERALQAVVAEPAEQVPQLELERLDALHAAAWDVMEREHLAVSNGLVVTRRVPVLTDDGTQAVEDGKPVWRYEGVLDDGRLLQAIDRLLKIQERRARLLGLDAPARSTVTVSNETDQEIERLVTDLAQMTRNPADR